jgi:hypothetical protein
LIYKKHKRVIYIFNYIMTTFVIKKPKLVKYIKKPIEKIILDVSFSYRILPINCPKKKAIILYKIQLSKTKPLEGDGDTRTRIYNRNNIEVYLNILEYANIATNARYLFYNSGDINPLLNRKLNKNTEFAWDTNISLNLFSLLKYIE